MIQTSNSAQYIKEIITDEDIKICIFNESAYCCLRGWIVKMKKKFSTN